MSNVVFHPHCELVSRSQGLSRGRTRSQGIPAERPVRRPRVELRGWGLRSVRRPRVVLRGWGLRWNRCLRVFSEVEAVTLGLQTISVLGFSLPWGHQCKSKAHSPFELPKGPHVQLQRVQLISKHCQSLGFMKATRSVQNGPLTAGTLEGRQEREV